MRHKGFTITSCVLLVLIIIMSVFVRVEAITWSVNVERLTTYTFYDGYPALAQTSDRRVWLVWSKEVEGNLTLFYKTTSNLGKTWSEMMNLTSVPGTGQNQNPSIMQAQNGTIWVSWTSDRPPPPTPPTPDFYLEASPQNLTIPQGESSMSTIIVTSTNNFSETVDLIVWDQPEGVTTALNPTEVVPPPDGTATSTLTISVDSGATPGSYNVSVIGRSDHLMHGVDIYLEISVAGGAYRSLAREIRRDIRMHSPSSMSTSSSVGAYVGDYEIYYKTSHDNGATWSRDIQLTDNNVDDTRPGIIQLTNGTIMVLWQTYISESFNIVCRATTDGISWSETTQLTTDSAHDSAPAVTQTKDGSTWVVWSSKRTGDDEIFYKIYDGISWSNDTRLTYTTNSSNLCPAILQGVNEEILIFWASSIDNGTYNIYYKYSANGSPWSESIEFAVSDYEDMWPATTQTRDTEIWVAWMCDRNQTDPDTGETYPNWDIYCRTSLAGDVNEDNEVNVSDLTIVSFSYGLFEGEPGYDPDADINKDGIVDLEDLVIVAYHLGES